MKRFCFAAAAVCLLLTACGQLNTETVDQIAAQQAETDETVPAESRAADAAEQVPDGSFDIDLTAMSGNMVYAQVYDMLTDTEKYVGKTVRVQGTFNYYQDPETKREYFAALVSDATACCAQGIEFVLPGDVHYPEDYPEQGTPIEISGTCNVYIENEQPFVELLNATMTVL